jgi:predicted transcriptional regulator YdeE
VKHRIVAKPAFQVVGVPLRTSNSRGEEIGALFGRFFAENTLARIPDKLGDGAITLYTDYESDHTGLYTIVLGAIVSRTEHVPPGMVTRTVPAQRYAAIESRGDMPAALKATWFEVWRSDLPRSFGVDFDLQRGSDAVDVHVALRE